MLYLISNELRKMMKDKKIKIIFMITFAVLIQMFLVEQSNFKNAIAKETASLEVSIRGITQECISLQTSLDYGTQYMTEDEVYRKRLTLKRQEFMKTQGEEMLNALESEDWRGYSQNVILLTEDFLAYNKNVLDTFDMIDYPENTDHPDYTIYKTFFTDWRTGQVGLEKTESLTQSGSIEINKLFEPTTTHILFIILRDILPILFPLVILLCAMDVFVHENRSGSYKFLLLLPVARGKIYLSKIASMAIATACFLVSIALILILLIAPLQGGGTWETPALIHEDTYQTVQPLYNNLYNDGVVNLEESPRLTTFNLYDVFGMVRYSSVENLEELGLNYNPKGNNVYNVDLIPTTIGEVVLYAVPLIGMIMLFIISFIAVISVCFQSSKMVMMLSSGFMLFVFMTRSPTTNISIMEMWNPFLYFHVVDIVTGTGSTTGLMGMIVLSIYSLIFIVTGYLIFRRQSIKC